MPCCGKTTQPHRRADPSPVHVGDEPASRREVAPVADVRLRYDGAAPITAIGSATRRRYRFGPGTVVPVDGRDVPSLAAVPGLHRVRAGA